MPMAADAASLGELSAARTPTVANRAPKHDEIIVTTQAKVLMVIISGLRR
jgi:hypothetical protein